MNFADKVALNILAKTMGSGLLIVSSIIMTRYLAKDTYGTYLQAMLLVNTVVMLSFVGLPQSFYYFFQQIGNKRRFIARNVLFGVAIGIVVALLMVIFKTALARMLGNVALERYVLLLALIVLLQSPLCFKEAIFYSTDALIASSLCSVTGAVIDYLPLYYAVISGWSLERLFLVFIASKAVNLAVFFLLLKKFSLDQLPRGGSDDVGPSIGILDQVRYAIPIGGAGYLGVVGSQVDKYIVSNAFSPEQFAVYSRGAMEVPFISTITYMLNDITLPRYVAAYKNRDVPQLLGLMHTNIDKVAKINLAVFAFLFVQAPLLIEILYTRQYVEAAPIFRVYLGSLLFGVTVYNMIPTVTGNTHILFKTTLFSTTIKILLCWGLIHLWGTMGVAVGVILETLLHTAYRLFYCVRILKVGWSEIMPWSNTAKIGLAAAASGAVAALGQWLLGMLGVGGNLLTFSLSFLFFCYFYLFVLHSTRMLHDEDRAFLKRWLRFDLFLFMPRLGRRATSPS